MATPDWPSRVYVPKKKRKWVFVCQSLPCLAQTAHSHNYHVGNPHYMLGTVIVSKYTLFTSWWILEIKGSLRPAGYEAQDRMTLLFDGTKGPHTQPSLFLISSGLGHAQPEAGEF